MPKRPIHKGQFKGFAGLCLTGAAGEENLGVWGDCIEGFYALENADKFGSDGTDNQTLENAINADLFTDYGVTDMWKMWSLCRSHICDSFVLRQFASDCIEHAGAVIMPNEQIVADSVDCARSYAVGDCDHNMLMAALETIEARRNVSPNDLEHQKHFLNIISHTLRPHPDGGAIQCVVNIPRCLTDMGLSDDEESAWQLTAFKQRCADAGYFDEA